MVHDILRAYQICTDRSYLRSKRCHVCLDQADEYSYEDAKYCTRYVLKKQGYHAFAAGSRASIKRNRPRLNKVRRKADEAGKDAPTYEHSGNGCIAVARFELQHNSSLPGTCKRLLAKASTNKQTLEV